MVRAVTAREEISSAKRTPTNANIVEEIERMHDEHGTARWIHQAQSSVVSLVGGQIVESGRIEALQRGQNRGSAISLLCDIEPVIACPVTAPYGLIE